MTKNKQVNDQIKNGRIACINTKIASNLTAIKVMAERGLYDLKSVDIHLNQIHCHIRSIEALQKELIKIHIGA